MRNRLYPHLQLRALLTCEDYRLRRKDLRQRIDEIIRECPDEDEALPLLQKEARARQLPLTTLCLMFRYRRERIFPETYPTLRPRKDHIETGRSGVAIACIGCNYSDTYSCIEPCTWLRIDRAFSMGVCSNCPDFVRTFDQGAQSLRRHWPDKPY